MMKPVNIAIDGPSGSGKSTAARNLAGLLGIEYIDTGAMYRAVALKTIEKEITPDNQHVAEMMTDTEIDFIDGKIYLDGQDVSAKIRTLEVSARASLVSGFSGCRKKLVDLQRRIASRKSVVMDGRDIGSHVLPGASFKFYVTAPLEIRAQRRWEEIGRRDGVTLEEVRRDLAARDEMDMTRELDPLVKAEDAIEISTEFDGIEETAQKLKEYILKGSHKE